MTAPSLTRLLETWQSWSYRDLLIRTISKADAAGDTDRADQLRRGLALEPDAAPLDALAANHELTRLLRGWQWHAIRAAREAGAGWEQIGIALGTTAEQARADYLDPIERAERYGGGLTDTTAYRAVLDDPPPPAHVQANTAARPAAAGRLGERTTRPAMPDPAASAHPRGGRR